MEWTRWRQDVFGDPYLVWHEGADLDQLTTRPPTELARMLPLGLHAGDHVAAQSYGHLSAAGLAPDDTETSLRSVVTTAEGAFLVAVAQALHVVTGDEEWAKPVVGVLALNEEHVSYKAAIALHEFEPTPYVVEALLTAVRTGEYLTRYHAANTLLAYVGDHPVYDIPEIFHAVSDNDPASYKTAVNLLSARLTERSHPSRPT